VDKVATLLIRRADSDNEEASGTQGLGPPCNAPPKRCSWRLVEPARLHAPDNAFSVQPTRFVDVPLAERSTTPRGGPDFHKFRCRNRVPRTRNSRPFGQPRTACYMAATVGTHPPQSSSQPSPACQWSGVPSTISSRTFAPQLLARARATDVANARPVCETKHAAGERPTSRLPREIGPGPLSRSRTGKPARTARRSHPPPAPLSSPKTRPRNRELQTSKHSFGRNQKIASNFAANTLSRTRIIVS